jgi:hypothetical protein
MRHVVAVALIGVIAGAGPAGTAGQWRASGSWPDGPQTTLSPPPSAVAPPLLSLVLPGAGQHVLGQNRKWLYLALEAAGWALWVERRAAAHDYRDRYREYAWERGRLQSGPRVDGDFEYYERLTQWMRSGAFDVDPASPGVQPEMDPTTYNGSIWSLASQIHLPPGPPPPETDPAYQSALAYYESRAYGTSLLWDWSAGSGSQQELARLIEASDHRFGQATTMLGAVIANHLVSAVDAHMSARGRSLPGRIRVVPDDTSGLAGGWLLVLSVDSGW